MIGNTRAVMSKGCVAFALKKRVLYLDINGKRQPVRQQSIVKTVARLRAHQPHMTGKRQPVRLQRDVQIAKSQRESHLAIAGSLPQQFCHCVKTEKKYIAVIDARAKEKNS